MAVKEVLGIIDYFPPLFFQVGHGFLDYLQIFIQGDSQDLWGVQIPAFAEDGDYLGFRLEERLNIAIIFRRDLGTASTAEGG